MVNVLQNIFKMFTEMHLKNETIIKEIIDLEISFIQDLIGIQGKDKQLLSSAHTF